MLSLPMTVELRTSILKISWAARPSSVIAIDSQRKQYFWSEANFPVGYSGGNLYSVSYSSSLYVRTSGLQLRSERQVSRYSGQFYGIW
jgi:hypothetical protein